MGAGLLYAAIIVGWAAYLIPHAMRRYDQASRSRSIDRFSSAMRVLGRKPAADSVATVKPSGPPSTSVAATTQRTGQRGTQRTGRAAELAAARVAARRRRRVLSVLLLATLTTAGVAALSYIPWWSIAIPATFAVLFLLACSRQVRRESEAYWETAETLEPVSRPAARVDSAYGSGRRPAASAVQAAATPAASAPPAASATPAAPVAAAGDIVSPDDEPTVVIDREDIAQIAVTVETSDGDVLWDPVPVTLPTYVSKPKARRTIRTIDLDQPGTWTSGNTEEATALVEQTTDPNTAEADVVEGVVEEPRRAVGS